MRSSLSALACACLTFGCAAGPAPPSPFPEAAGRHFEVTCRHPCGGAARQASSAAEAALEEVEFLLGAAPTGGSLRIHLYPAASFPAVAREEAGGRFQENLGFAVPLEGVAHIGIEGDSTGLGPADLRRVTHEASHLAAARITGGTLPDWLSEGLATWVEREVSARHGGGASGLHDPWLALHAWRALRLSDQGALPAPEEIVLDSVALTPAEAYAVRSVFFRYLRQHRWELLEAVLAAAQDEARLATLLERALSGELERGFGAYVSALADSVPWTRALPHELPGR